MVTNLVSIKSTIGKFLKDLGLSDTSYVEDLPRWTEDAISIIGIPSYYVHRKEVKEIREGRCLLPCDMEVLHSVFITDSLDKASDISQLRRLFIRDIPILASGDISCPNSIANYGSINGNFLYTSFKEGYVYFVYKGVPLDCDGYPMVPKSAELNTALQYYFIQRMALSGYKHPVLSFNDALMLWEKHYPRASNDVNWMNLQEYQTFTEMWTNPLLGDLNANNYIF